MRHLNKFLAFAGNATQQQQNEFAGQSLRGSVVCLRMVALDCPLVPRNRNRSPADTRK